MLVYQRVAPKNREIALRKDRISPTRSGVKWKSQQGIFEASQGTTTTILGIYHTQKGWIFCIWHMAMRIHIYIYNCSYYPLEPGFGLSAVLANFRQNPSAGAGCTSDRFLDVGTKGWLYSSAPAGFAPSRISPRPLANIWISYGVPCSHSLW